MHLKKYFLNPFQPGIKITTGKIKLITKKKVALHIKTKLHNFATERPGEMEKINY